MTTIFVHSMSINLDGMTTDELEDLATGLETAVAEIDNEINKRMKPSGDKPRHPKPKNVTGDQQT